MKYGLEGIKKSFGRQTVFDGLDFDFSKCGLYLIKGESGSGKTTLLNIIAGYEDFDGGKRVIEKGTKIAYIFQTYELINNLTVAENIDLFENLYHITFDKKQDIIEILGLQDIMDHYPDECSGGQKQRIGIARALMMDPEIIICDEPTESLDMENKQNVMELLTTLAKEKIVLLASHETELIEKYQPVVYEIIDKKLQSNDEIDNEVVEAKDVLLPKPDQKYLKKIIRKILHHSSIVQLLIILVIALTALVSLQTYFIIFKPIESLEILNSYEIYIEVNNDDEENPVRGPGERIVKFDNIILDGRKYRINVVPIVTNNEELEFYGQKEINGNEIIINQNVAKVLMDSQGVSKEKLIGQEMNLSYKIDFFSNEDTFEIAGIVYEDDVQNVLQVYYSNDYFKQTRSISEDMDYYVYHSDSKNIENDYYRFSKNTQLETTNLFVENMERINNEMGIFELVFKAVVIVIFTTLLIYTIYSLKKQWRQVSGNLAIIASCLVPLSKIKSSYIKEKFKELIIIDIVLMGESLLYLLLIGNRGIEINAGVIIVLNIIYLVMLLINIRSIKDYEIATILKDDKDN